MRLPKNILSGNYTKPDVFLCEVDKAKICQLSVTDLNGSFKFNSYSEISFEISRVYNDLITGETKVHPFYDKIEAFRLILVQGFGYFELQAPELIGDGIKESKQCTAYSLEYTLSTKYLESFYINQGTVESLEVLNASDSKNIVPITLYNPNNKNLSLLHLILEKVYGWKIGHVDASLQTLSRQFEVDRESVYDFIMNEICEKFNCYVVFDTINNTINVYAESLTSKFIADGETDTFIISPPFSQIGTVSVDGYKTTRWDYDELTGSLVLEDTPESGAYVEVVDGALTEWETDVYITFDNLSKEINVNYDADSIKTVLTVTYGEDGNIREVNLGLPYLTDISYFCTVDWMGQDLYDAYIAYQQKCNNYQSEYTSNIQKMLEIDSRIDYEENRLSLEYSIVQSVNASTVGTYYIRGGTAPDYYYTKVSLPSEYKVDTIYYSPNTTNLQDGSDGNVSALYSALQKYYYNYFHLDKNSELYESYQEGVEEALNDIKELSDRFAFMDGNYTISKLYDKLKNISTNSEGGRFEEFQQSILNLDKEKFISGFLDEMWNQLGKTPLEDLYYEPYKEGQIAQIEAGHSQKDHDNYGFYYPLILLLKTLESAINKRKMAILLHKKKYETLQKQNAAISESLLMDNNFTDGQLVILNAFLREDELHIDDIIETSIDTIADSFKIKQDAVESGRIELQKICQPQLQFSMDMANIYALPEFEPIIDQFQLGKVIKVALRPDYIKQSRLLQVDINFDDFSDFSCEFGELTSLRTQSDIHADLLSQAVSAGKSVATNASYWTRGSDQAASLDLKIQNGLLDSATTIKSIDGLQEVSIDNYGIHLRKKKENGDGYEDKQGWIVNNQFLYSDDDFKSTKSVFGEYKIPTKYNKETGEKEYESYWGLLAEAVIAGYVEGSKIRGGTIQIGELDDGSWSFEVDADGNVSMLGGLVEFSGSTNSLEDAIDNVNEDLKKKMSTLTLNVTNNSDNTSSTIKLMAGEAMISSQEIKLNGLVSFTDLETEGSTTINGANITTGSVTAEKIDVESLMAENLKATNAFEVDNGVWKLVQSDTGLKIETAAQSYELPLSYLSLLATKGSMACINPESGVWGAGVYVDGETYTSRIEGSYASVAARGSAVQLSGQSIQGLRHTDEDWKDVLLDGDIPDYVTEQGTSGVWTYEKWLSGRMRMWAKIPVADLAIDTAMGALYRSGSAFSKSGNAFPFAFTDVPCVTANYAPSNGVGAMIWWAGEPTTAQLHNCYLISYQSATTSGTVYVTVDGFWK